MVGIPSFKNAATIGYVVRAAQAGLVQYFPDLHPVLVNSDAGLARRHGPRRGRDRAARLHRADPPRPPDEPPAAGQPDLPRDRRRRRQGRRAADHLRDRRRAPGPGPRRRRLATCARSCPNGSSSSPGRSSRAATTSSRRCTRATSTTARSPTPSPTRSPGRSTAIASASRSAATSACRAISSGTTSSSTTGPPDISTFGIDIWMTTSAITGGFAVCQTRLGAKIHDPKDPGSDLGPMFRQVVGHDPAPGQPVRRPVAADQRQPRRPGLRLRTGHRAATARGQHAAAAVRVPRRLADPRRHVGRHARPGDRDDGARAGGRGGPPRGCRPDPAGARRRRRLDDRHHARDGRCGRRLPLPG